MNLFWFLKKDSEPRRYPGEVVDLVVEKKVPGMREGAGETIWYGIYQTGTNIRVGYCDLRLGMNEELYYAGNIGYHILQAYRGHHYAYEACLLLFEIAREEYEQTELIITCSPENTPSRKTLEKLNGELLEVTDVPRNHWLYRQGERVKNIYRYKI